MSGLVVAEVCHSVGLSLSACACSSLDAPVVLDCSLLESLLESQCSRTPTSEPTSELALTCAWLVLLQHRVLLRTPLHACSVATPVWSTAI